MSDQHLVALQGIWNEMKTLNGRVNQTNERLDETNRRLEKGFADVNLRLDGTNERLVRVEERVGAVEERVGAVETALRHTEIRIATELIALHGTMDEVKNIVKGAFTSDRTRITKLERRVDALESERKPK